MNEPRICLGPVNPNTNEIGCEHGSFIEVSHEPTPADPVSDQRGTAEEKVAIPDRKALNLGLGQVETIAWRISDIVGGIDLPHLDHRRTLTLPGDPLVNPISRWLVENIPERRPVPITHG
jgi:hypothetical protein